MAVKNRTIKKKQISFIMKPTFEEVANGFTFDLSDIQKKDIYAMVHQSYDDGYSEGYERGHDRGFESATEDLPEPEVNEEQIGVAYVVEEFDSVTTFEEFRTKYLELVRLNLTYIPPLGLHKSGGQLLFKAKN